MWGFSTPTPLIVWVHSSCPFFLVCGVWRKWKWPCMQVLLHEWETSSGQPGVMGSHAYGFMHVRKGWEWAENEYWWEKWVSWAFEKWARGVEREDGGDGYVGKKDDEVRVTMHFGPHAHGEMVEVSWKWVRWASKKGGGVMRIKQTLEHKTHDDTEPHYKWHPWA